MSNQSLIEPVIDNKSKMFFLIFPLIMTIILLFRELNNDIWFLLTHGRYVMEHGIPYIEPFTIHEGFKFVMQQWLSALLFYFTYMKLGEFGLKLLVICTFIASMMIFYKLCLKLTNNNFVKSVFVTYIYIGLINIFMTTRPYIFTNIIIILEIYALESYFLKRDKKALWILPILSVVLINIQASMWLMILIILIPYIIDSLGLAFGPFKSNKIESKPLFTMVFLVFIVGFLNPYGLDAMTYLFKSYGVPQINDMVTEMAPVDVNSILGLMIVMLTTGFSFFYTFSKSKNKAIRHILLTLGTSFLALSSIRGFIFFICCGIFPLTMYIGDFRIPQFNTKFPKRTLKIRKILISLIVLMLSLLIYQYSVQNSGYISNKEYFLSSLEMVIGDKNVEKVILYTGYNDGGLAEFYNIPSYIDPRAEVFLKQNNMVSDVFIEYYDVQKGYMYYRIFLNKYNFTHLVVDKNDILYTYLEYDIEYELISSNRDYKVYKRKI